MTEAEIMHAIHAVLGSRSDVRIWRQQVALAVPVGRLCARCRALPPIRYGLPGMADLLGVHRGSGKIISCEVKSATGKLTDEQLAWSAMIESFNGINLTRTDGVHSSEEATQRLEEYISGL